MKNLKKSQIFILYFLLFSCTIAILGMGLDGHSLPSASGVESSSITSQTFTTSDNLTTIHVSEGNIALAIIRGIRNNSRQKSYGGSSVLLIFILTILSGVFRLTQGIYGFYHRLYVWHRHFLIAYIHAIDGRKRLASC